ncbi:MAG: hypothetical protein KatS3mg051_2059 [Anaerolineae bacterium]|nr:MAG: hypothetical protein KatS3mg051_1688 [Anaerolineae bacterium]GIV82543.1 MAG: hypothetical protein KatS3mg051_1897 [Anaerolineae bacterium]GIV82705.1 MAG: hypothetical protein KatS3mg051_2059 [Anaerolineae bacterium]
MRVLIAIIALCVIALPDASAQVVYLVGDDLPPVRVEEAIGPTDTLTVVVDTSGAGHYMVHRADSIFYHISGYDVGISRSAWEIIMSEITEWVRTWEAVRRLGEQ